MLDDGSAGTCLEASDDMKDITKIIRYSWSLKRYYLWIAFLVVVVSLAQPSPAVY